MKILGIGAHPDDLEFLAGGTLAKCSGRGDNVVMACVSRGDKSGDGNADEIVKTREKERKASAELINAESVCLGFSDSEIFDGDGLRKAVIELIRKVSPDVIITHCPEDYHADHRAAGKAASDAAYIASSRGFKTKSKHASKIPTVYYMDSLAGMNFIPEEYVDITDFFKKKLEMLKKHLSQFGALKERGGIDLLELAADTAKLRGWQSCVKYAEGFRSTPWWPNKKTERLLP
jgi:N-acetylglucosamine malate deacetylase 1